MIFLELMNVVLRLLETVPGENAFALFMDLEHMKLSFLAGPPKYLLKHMGDVMHKIHRIVPANHEEAGFQVGLRLILLMLNGCRGGQQIRRNCLCHNGKLARPRVKVERGEIVNGSCCNSSKEMLVLR